MAAGMFDGPWTELPAPSTRVYVPCSAVPWVLQVHSPSCKYHLSILVPVGHSVQAVQAVQAVLCLLPAQQVPSQRPRYLHKISSDSLQ